MKIKELIKELQKYDQEAEIVNGDAITGFCKIELCTVKSLVFDFILEDFCEEHNVTPETITIVSKYSV